MTPLKQVMKDVMSNRAFMRIFRGNRFIFLFHDVSNKDAVQYSDEYSTPISLFEEQVDLLQHLFEIVPLERIVADKDMDNSKNYAAITFDDGFYSVLENARPILNKREIPYTIFLNAAAIKDNQLWFSNLQLAEGKYRDKLLHISHTEIGSNEDLVSAIYTRGKFDDNFRAEYKIPRNAKKIFMDFADIAILQEEGVLIGSHSYDHFVLNFCDDETRRIQIEENNELLQKIAKQRIRHFAIPFGKKEHFDDITIAAIKQAGHKYIYTSNPNKFTVEDLRNPNFLFPRIGISNSTPNELLFIINRALFKKYDL